MAPMERLYKALVWLAAVALVLGLVIAYLYATLSANLLPNGYYFGGSDGLIVAFLRVLRSRMFEVAISLSNLLGSGAFVLAAVLAWMQRRRAWLTALVVAALLALVWPSFMLAWQIVQFPPGPSGPPESELKTFNIISLTIPLIPFALPLIFALIRRKPAAATTTDAELGIVRSRL
jgi:hypothetical protein